MDVQNSLQRALHHLKSGAPADCLGLCNEILADTPGLIEALYLRGCAAFETGNLEQAISDLEVVHSNHPEHQHAAYHFGRALRHAGRFEDGVEPLRAAIGAPELEIAARYELGICLTGSRRRPEAIVQYRAILSQQHGNSQAAANLASVLERENDLEEAEHWTSVALRQDPSSETAKMTRAILCRRAGKYAEAAEQLRVLSESVSNPINLSIIWNQLGQCLESQEKWGEAFNAFSTSNQVLKDDRKDALPDPRGPHGIETLGRLEEWLLQKPLTNWVETAVADEGGIVFLVGFPRSGTTLLDRMLSAHPDIEVLEEKSLFARLHQDWSAPGTLEALADVNDAQIIDARRIYRQEMSAHRRHPHRSLVVDKLPLNLAYLFLIYRLFPKAPVIFLQRNPMDACLSCYFQAFELRASMGYFLDIEQTAQYYDSVMKVASLSLQQIGNQVHRLRYEDLVTAPEEQLEKLVRFLGLEESGSMIEYWRQDVSETSNTPSYQQVSQRLYTGSIDRWRHYSAQLDPILPVLQPWVNHK